MSQYPYVACMLLTCDASVINEVGDLGREGSYRKLDCTMPEMLRAGHAASDSSRCRISYFCEFRIVIPYCDSVL